MPYANFRDLEFDRQLNRIHDLITVELFDKVRHVEAPRERKGPTATSSRSLPFSPAQPRASRSLQG